MVPLVGDRATDTSPAARKAVVRELALLWLATCLAIRLVVLLQGALGLPDVVLAAVPFLFIYAPVWLCHHRKVDSYGYRLAVPAFRDWRAWWDGLRQGGSVMLVVLPVFLVGYHLWQTWAMPRIVEGFCALGVRAACRGYGPFGFSEGAWPADVLTLVLYQVFFVAIPEEFFYRGYFQTRLNEVFPRRFILFGIPFGHGLFIATAFFAFGHSLVRLQWWHFATFFPGLVFAMLRERSGQVLPGAFFHAMCNILVVSLDTRYGLIQP